MYGLLLVPSPSAGLNISKSFVTPKNLTSLPASLGTVNCPSFVFTTIALVGSKVTDCPLSPM